MPDIEIAIPVERESRQLDKTLGILELTAPGVAISVINRPDLNVAEARQVAMDKAKSRYLCFLDYDSEMYQPGWLNAISCKFADRPDAAVVFAKEWWGTEPCGELYADLAIKMRRQGHLSDWVDPVPSDEVQFGPGACMALDLQKIPSSVKWNARIGLRNGWLGGDCEEVEFERRLMELGLKMYKADCMFHHVERENVDAWAHTDRGTTAKVMIELIGISRAEEYRGDAGFFDGLKYVRAGENDNMLATGESLIECYRGVFDRNGLWDSKLAQRLGWKKT